MILSGTQGYIMSIKSFNGFSKKMVIKLPYFIRENSYLAYPHNPVNPVHIQKDHLMKRLLAATIILLLASTAGAQSISHLQQNGTDTQLIVNGKPYIILGGELGNSTASSMDYMESAWPKFRAMHLNTILAPVYWELIEKKEGKFDFSLVDELIREARKQDLKLVFLWFGSWKNSMSCYAPGWVKKNQDRFPRIKDEQGESHEILTPFSDNNLQADKEAFVKLMQHLKSFDGEENTVIMVQVENEIGMLPTARDHHPKANVAFNGKVPDALISYLQEHKDTLVPTIRNAWKEQEYRTSGSWQEVFGKDITTDEFFMSWYYGVYANEIAKAGKEAYSLPMYVNAALNRPNEIAGKGYPSGGPLPHLMDIWKAATPDINFMVPDIYFQNIKHWTDLYTRQGDPLFIPEHRFDEAAAAKAFFTIGHYQSLGFSPFSIESTDRPEEEPLGKAYNILQQIVPVMTKHTEEGNVDGVLLDKDHSQTVIEMGDYVFTFKHDYTLGWSPNAKNDHWPESGAVIIHTGENQFIIAGTGVVVTFKPLGEKGKKAGILKIDEGKFVDGTWIPGRRMNGDQSHQGRHLRVPVGDYNIQKLELYKYE